MKIIYFGTDVFLSIFRWLIESEHEILALYTYHNQDEYIRDEGVCALAKQYEIPIHHERITEAEVTEAFQTGRCDLLLSAEYDAKIPTPNIENFRGVNIHNSLLPEGRGYFPVEMRIFKGYDYGGVTIHKLVEKFDQGDIVLQKKFPIATTENDRMIYAKCNAVAAKMTKELLGAFEEYWQNAIEQQGGSYWEKPTKEDYTITEDMTIAQIEHVYRSFGRFTVVQYDDKEDKVEHIETQNSLKWIKNREALKAKKYILFKAVDGVLKIYLQNAYSLNTVVF